MFRGFQTTAPPFRLFCLYLFFFELAPDPVAGCNGWWCASPVFPSPHGGTRDARLKNKQVRDKQVLRIRERPSESGYWDEFSRLFHETPSPSRRGDPSGSLCCVLVPSALVSDSTMCSGGKYCVFLFLLQSILSDPGTTNQGEFKEGPCTRPQVSDYKKKGGCAKNVTISKSLRQQT